MYCSYTPVVFSRINGGNFCGLLQLGHSVIGCAGTVDPDQPQYLKHEVIVIINVTNYLDRNRLNIIVHDQVKGCVYADFLRSLLRRLRSRVWMNVMLADLGSCFGVGCCITQRSSLESPSPVTKGRIKLLTTAPTTFTPSVTIVVSRFHGV